MKPRPLSPPLDPSPSTPAAESVPDDPAFIEAVRQYGRDFKAISLQLSMRGLNAAKHYYYKHKTRLGLDAVMAQREEEAALLVVSSSAAQAGGGGGGGRYYDDEEMKELVASWVPEETLEPSQRRK